MIKDMADHTISDFTGFQVTRVLSENNKTKYVAVCGTFSSEPDLQAVILAEKQPIHPDSLPLLFSPLSRLKLNFQNDIYCQYEADTNGSLGSLQLTTIYPATSKHITKYSSQQLYMIRETPDDYEAITRSYIETQALSLQWVHNILDGTREADRVIYNDPDPLLGFVLLPDLKWDSTDLNSLYLVAIVRQKGIASLRDLSGKHLPLLKNILQKGKEVIHEIYGVHGNQLRFYIHYQASYYHFHIHVTHILYEAPGSQVGRAHLLDDVIDNLETVDNNFYKKRTLIFVLKECDELLKKFSNQILLV